MDALASIAHSWRLAVETGATCRRQTDRRAAHVRARAFVEAATAILAERRVELRSVDVVATLSRLSSPTKG
jgi:hypothetical protein